MVCLREALQREVAGSRAISPIRLAGVFLFGRGSQRVPLLLRLRESVTARGWRSVARLLTLALERGHGVHISDGATIGLGIRFPHPTGIVIGEGVVIGSDCVIYQNVTIGGAIVGDSAAHRYPRLGSCVTVFAGAAIIGQLTVGDGTTIGANSVVRTDTEPGSVVVGVPARRVGVTE